MEYSEGLMTELRTLEDFEKSLSLTKVGERRIKALRKCRDDFKKLHLPDVSDQRELLIAFMEYLSELTMGIDDYDQKELLDDFESNL
tara:strand:- start:986 stop:1246 length:261 start_codon:yes stop_codon:yes gene_type:complete